MYASVPRLAVPDYYTAIIMIVPHVHGLEINNQASKNISQTKLATINLGDTFKSKIYIFET